MWSVTSILDGTVIRYKYFYYTFFTCKEAVDLKRQIIFSKVTELVNGRAEI